MAETGTDGLVTRRKASANKDASADEVEQMVRAVLQFLEATKTDRIVYLAISTLSFVVLVGLLGWALAYQKIETAAAFTMFGATGVVTLCAAGVLKVWSDCMSLLKQVLLRDRDR
ncbi:MAG TPA: hypothetical protein VN682_20455 [Terriglobales bacterium]|nr:hypothetical protein [Terriglobales bacterium]